MTLNINYKHWNEGYKKYTLQKPKYDLWLDKHSNILTESKDTPIIDLGCGLGNDSLYLLERGYKVISCDFFEVAINRVKELVPGAQGMVMDMLNGLPFEDSSIKVLIADLSLHYFYWKDTMRIVNEISRVLTPGGYLLSRLNSTKDINHGANQGTIIEKNYYAINDTMKRFFDKEDIVKLFRGWNIKYINEYEICRYEFPKILWEIALKNS